MSKIKSRNKNLLDSFVKYCSENPQERFWQALRNWAGVWFVFTASKEPLKNNLIDTFNWENKNG